jgi:TonB family protein
VTIGRPRVAGGLDKNIIRRYIRRMLPRIRYCYERQLLVKRHLRGTVYVRFTIDPNGRVLNPVASGVDKAVSTCVAQVIRRLRFPKPPGGGLVHVTYPFQFRPGGSSSGGVTPLEPPPPPPPPKPQMQPTKPRPIDAPESPLVSKVTEPPPPPKGPLACHPAARPDGLEAILPAAEACYEHLLDREPEATGRLFVTLSIDGSGVITDTVAQGIPDRHLATCVARAAKALVLSGREADALRGGNAIFSLYLDKDGGEQGAMQTVTATDHDLRLGLRLMASEVAWNKVDAVQRAAWKRVASEATDDPLVLQIADDIDAGAVLAATVALAGKARQVRYARALEGGGWKIVNPLGDGTFRGVCPGQPASRVSVLIDRDGIWVGTDKGRDHVPMADGKHDLLGYARLLRTLRRRELADRSDLEIAVTAGVPYGAFARALEIAIETGFHDTEVRPVGQIRNPRRQAARPR